MKVKISKLLKDVDTQLSDNSKSRNGQVNSKLVEDIDSTIKECKILTSANSLSPELASTVEDYANLLYDQKLKIILGENFPYSMIKASLS